MRAPRRYRLGGLLLMVASMAAVAQPGPRGDRFSGPRGEPRQERMQQGGSMDDRRGGPGRMREFRGNADGDARGGADETHRRDERMSPDDRRQLRRDIHDAGRDIYRPRPRRFEQ